MTKLTFVNRGFWTSHLAIMRDGTVVGTVKRSLQGTVAVTFAGETFAYTRRSLFSRDLDIRRGDSIENILIPLGLHLSGQRRSDDSSAAASGATTG